MHYYYRMMNCFNLLNQDDTTDDTNEMISAMHIERG